jgi:hypothetical protein
MELCGRAGSVRSSFDTTINVLEGLLEFERATGGSAAVSEARESGEEYLLERSLFRRKSTGEGRAPARERSGRGSGRSLFCLPVVQQRRAVRSTSFQEFFGPSTWLPNRKNAVVDPGDSVCQ